MNPIRHHLVKILTRLDKTTLSGIVSNYQLIYGNK